MCILKLYHGSGTAVPQPRLEQCRPHNDYGRGFYCTQSDELAKEWACQRGRSGFVSSYEIDAGGLDLVDLNSGDRCILHWLAVLLEHRLCRLSTPTMQRGSTWLTRYYSVDISHADIVKGYRADDSYFGFARAFLRNEITLAQLSHAMMLGELGEQYMIKSAVGFDALRFTGSEPADSAVYWARRETRDENARTAFQEMLLQGLDEPSSSGSAQGDDMPQLFISALMSMSEEERHACLQ